MLVANTTLHPSVYVLAIAIPEDELGLQHRAVVELFNIHVQRLSLLGISVIVPNIPATDYPSDGTTSSPTFPQSSPYVTTVTFPASTNDEGRYVFSHDPCPHAIPCEYNRCSSRSVLGNYAYCTRMTLSEPFQPVLTYSLLKHAGPHSMIYIMDESFLRLCT